MMRIASVSEAQTIDRLAQSQHGLSGEILMESAGALAGQEVRTFYRNSHLRGWIGVVCGIGGNGADGLVAARHLASAGLKVRVFLLDATSSHGLFQLNFKRLPQEIERRSIDEVAELSKAALVVDALFGIGLSREIHGAAKLFIDEMNASKAPVVSLDAPSGLDADRGVSLGAAVRASLTLTFGLAKRGFFVSEGPRHIGRLKIVPIGFPQALVRKTAISTAAFGAQSSRRILPRRRSSSNKSTSGRVVIFAGRSGMIGASLLAGLGASRAGAGYVSIVTRAPADIATVAPEFLTLDPEAKDLFEKTDGAAVIVGPGYGVGEKTSAVLETLSQRRTDSVVVDADALTTLADLRKQGQPLPILKSWILTPHAGELSRLIGGQAKDLEANRFEATERAARELGAIVLFKGFRTVVSDGQRSCVILSGNAALAKAGSGDFLSGLIAGFLAQNLAPFEAACLGAYVHGRMADEWIASGRDQLSLQPSDLAQMLPALLARLRAGAK